MVRTIACACVLGIVSVQQPAAPAPFDPVGRWSVSTTSDEGHSMTATVEIGGKPGSYSGQAVTNLGRVLPIREIMTSPTGMMMVAELPQSLLIIRVTRDASGKHTGNWGEVLSTYPLTAERAGR
jgi:hypothetical protein